MGYNETLHSERHTMFLRKRAFQIKLVDPDAPNNSTTPADILTPDSIQLIEDAGTRLMRNLGIAVVAVVGAIKLFDTLGEIAVKKTKSADNEK